MKDFHRNKHLLGELTMGEYYELAKFPPIAALKVGDSYFDSHDVAMTGEHVVFLLEGCRRGDLVCVPRDSKVRIKDNQVSTKDGDGKDVDIRFYDLTPTPDPLKRRKR